MKPVVKWAGGKTQLLSKIDSLLPKQFNDYYEPFAGGAAVLFHLKPNKAYLNDWNKELMHMYSVIKESPEDLKLALAELDNNHSGKEYYLIKRSLYNEKLLNNIYDTELAALFIYLNKHCFNGLYRVNSKGLFNVPCNTKSNGSSIDEDNFNEVSSYLQNVELTAGDFEPAVQSAKAGDFVFFDSPYAPLKPTSFESYTKEGFPKEDHERLARLFKELDNKGVYCMLTNHNTEFVRDLYKDYNINVVEVKRAINRDANNRKGEEVIITNYEV